MQSNSSLNPNPSGLSRRKQLVKQLLRSFGRATEYTLALIGLAYLIYWCCFDMSIVASPSMAPTLMGTSIKNGDHVLAEHVTYWFRTPRRWEVVMYFNPQNTRIMKRVVGLPGETVSLPRAGQLMIDGRQMQPPSHEFKCWYYPQGALDKGKSVQCGNGYFVLGDSSGDSDDSRFNGPLPAEKVAGRAWLIVWPWNRIGFVNP